MAAYTPAAAQHCFSLLRRRLLIQLRCPAPMSRRRRFMLSRAAAIGVCALLSFLLITGMPLMRYVRQAIHNETQSLTYTELSSGTNLVVLGQPRSGTSFLSALFAAQSNSSVYWFEPLWRIGYRGFSDDKSVLEITDSLFNCHFPMDTLGIPIFPRGLWLGPNYLHRVGHGTKYPEHMSAPAGLGCREASLRVIKYVRVSMNNLIALLHRYKSLKAIYITRDPRAIGVSQFSTFSLMNRTLLDQVQLSCHRLVLDLDNYLVLPRHIQKRILLINYEQFVLSPYDVLNNTFTWLNLPFTESARTFLDTHINNCTRLKDKFSNCARTNSPSKLIHYWRKNLTTDQIDKLNIICAKALQYLQNQSV